MSDPEINHERMHPDGSEPAWSERDDFDFVDPVSKLGINKALSVQFVLGYSPDEFANTLHHLAEGRIPAEPIITGKVGVEGVAEAFEDLGSPEKHAKILIEPWR